MKSTVLPAEARTKSVITAATNTPGSSVTAGCSRISDAPVPAVVRTLSAHSASARASTGSGGPKPRLASWRSRLSTALRSPTVSPGTR